MDKEEFRLKLEQINSLVEERNYAGAMEIVDSINWRRVRSINTLRTVGKIYERNKRYEDSKVIFELAYNHAQNGKSMKSILRHLIEISLKLKDISDAEEFYEEFEEIAPRDNARYILKYKIGQAKNVSIQEQIAILEEYRDTDSDLPEKWLYELAELYYKANEKDKCKELCDEMVLYFGDGPYVMKALDLKMRMGVLNGSQKEKYEKQFIPNLITPEEFEAKKATENKAPEEEERPEIESIRIRNVEDVETIQEKISKGIRDIFGSKKLEEDLLEEENLEEKMTESEEMLKKASSEEVMTNVPELEQEDGQVKPKENEEKDVDFSLKMPVLNIPQSMKKADAISELNIPEIPKPTVFINLDEASSEKKEEEEFSFNLEDTILAAATAQGIEIPKEEKELPEVEDPFEAELLGSDEKEEEFEEELSEEEKQLAEAEFLNGPQAVQEPAVKNTKKREVLDLEPEVITPGISEQIEEDDFDTEDFFSSLIGKTEKKKETVKEPEKDELLNELSAEEKDVDDIFNFDFEDEEMPSKSNEPEALEDDEEFEEDEYEEEELTEEEKLERFIESITPKDDRDPMDIIPREYELTEEEQKLFSYFVKVPKMKEQILDALCDAQNAAADFTSKTGNIIVMGARESGKTRLISSLIPAICKELNIAASKVAYVFAEQINDKDIFEIVKKLAGGFLVIENANQLNQQTAEMLDKAMNSDTAGLTVILEDEKISMRKMMARYPKLTKKFTSVINITTFTIDELVNFAIIYAKENGYKIDQMGMLALHNLIGSNRKEDEPMTIGTVKIMIDNAIKKSQSGIRKLKKGKKVDRDGFMVLFEKDFKNK